MHAARRLTPYLPLHAATLAALTAEEVVARLQAVTLASHFAYERWVEAT